MVCRVLVYVFGFFVFKLSGFLRNVDKTGVKARLVDLN